MTTGGTIVNSNQAFYVDTLSTLLCYPVGKCYLQLRVGLKAVEILPFK